MFRKYFAVGQHLSKRLPHIEDILISPFTKIMKHKLFIFLLTLFFTQHALAQGELPVNLYTGRAGMFIDLYTLTDHDLSEKITLSYNVNGVNLSTLVTYGVGWNLNVGGQVTREVRGLPDDFSDATRSGWLYNSQYASLSGFAGTSDLSPSTCADETSDQAFISNLQYVKDTEPDWFSFSVGGISGHFVFNNSGTVSLIPYQDVNIVPTYSGTAGAAKTIIGWTITTNQGISYSLNEKSAASKVVSKYLYPAMMTLYDAEYNMYKTLVYYSSAWMLTQTTSPSTASLTYTYKSTTSTQTDTRPTAFYHITTSGSGQASQNPTVINLMLVTTTSTSKSVATITTSSGTSAVLSDYLWIDFIDPARSAGSFKTIQFNYMGKFLLSISENNFSSCFWKAPYKFYYNGVDQDGNTTYPTSGSSPNQDYWGFYNGANNSATQGSITPTLYVYPNEATNERYRIYPIPSYVGTQVTLNGNANRMPNANAMMIGTLSRVVYPSGGETDLVFEPHQYYDAKTGTDQLAGGLRIKSATYYDGVNPNATISKTYSYVDATGHSTGRLISRPSFAIPVWQYITPSQTISYSTLAGSGTNYVFTGLTAVTQNNLSTDDRTNGDATVGYTHVSVARPGSGSVVYDYYVPAGYGDSQTGASATDWTPTTMKFARPPDCPIMGVIPQGETWGYPTFTNAYYDYERGLEWSKLEYNNAGTPVRKTLKTYQYLFRSGSTPTKVAGLAYEHFANSSEQIFLYGAYSLIADVTKVLASETVTTYDENNSGSSATQSTQYTFNSPNHKLLSKVAVTTADGTVYGTNYSYVLDYPVTSTTPTDTTLWMIQQLKNLNITGAVIEQTSTVQLPAGVQRTTAASLVKYRLFSSKPAVKYRMAFRPNSPVTDFVTSGVNGSYAFYNDTRYDTIATINECNNYLVPISSTGEDKNTNGTLWGYNERFPVANFSQARSSSIAFSDFETTTVASFNVTNGYNGQGRTGSNGIHPYATLSRTVSKPASASKFLLSFWLKNQVGTNVTLQVTLKDATNTTTLSTSSYTFNLTGSSYQFFKQPIDVSSMPSSFTINIQGLSLAQPSGSSTSLLPMVDDISFYPDYATLSSTTFDIPFGPNSSTDVSGQTTYSVYDQFGRLKLVKDQQGNIKQRITYAFTGETVPMLSASASVTTPSPLYINTPIQFEAALNGCFSGAVYEWDFGDGNGYINLGANANPTKTYTTVGTYVVNVRVSHPSSAPQVSSFNILVLKPLVNNLTGSQNGAWVTLTSSVTNALGYAITYSWQQRTHGTTTWGGTGSNSSTLTQKILPGTSIDFKVTATSSDGRTMDSNVLTYSYQ